MKKDGMYVNKTLSVYVKLVWVKDIGLLITRLLFWKLLLHERASECFDLNGFMEKNVRVKTKFFLRPGLFTDHCTLDILTHFCPVFCFI